MIFKMPSPGNLKTSTASLITVTVKVRHNILGFRKHDLSGYFHIESLQTKFAKVMNGDFGCIITL